MPFTIIRLASIDSTSSEAFRLLESGARDQFAVVADRQTAGRGRRGRQWSSPPGNLYVSMVTAPGVPAAQAGELAFVAAVATAEAIATFVEPKAVSLKWPNDVLVGNAKLGGILIETRIEAGTVRHSVAGVGLNVAVAPEGMPYPVTSLRGQGADIARDDVLNALTSRYDHWHRAWRAHGFSPVRTRWMDFAWRLDEDISIVSDTQTANGRFAGIDDAGALLLDVGGKPIRFSSGSMSYNSHQPAF